MTDADRAYEAAEKLIAEALESGADRLSFDRPDTHALDRIPPQIAELSQLRHLDFDDTQVSDLSALSGLRGLSALRLDRTQVSDLSPISDLEMLRSLWLDKTPVTDLSPLVSLLALVDAPTPTGLTFRGCAATQQDPRVAEISKIGNNKERAATLFAYLKGQAPPERTPDPEQTKPPPTPPTPQVAPLLTSYQEGRMVRAAPEGLPEHDVLTRAEMGWAALKAYRDSFANSFNIHNYAPLPEFLAAFDTAMGPSFDPQRMISIGVMGGRIVGLSQDTAFLENLPAGAETDLQGFAAAIDTYLNRFPDWLAYRTDADQSEVTDADTKAEEAPYRALGEELRATPEVDPAVSEEFDAEVDAAMAPTSDDAVAKGLAASTRELARELSEKALDGVKDGKIVRDAVQDMDEVADAEVAKLKFWSYGWTLVVLRRRQRAFRRLARRFPREMGWLESVLDYLVGPEPKEKD